MSIALSTVLGALLDRLLGEPRRWHPLVGFGRYARFVERAVYDTAASPRLRGLLAVMLALLPFVALAALTRFLPYGFVFDIVLLYLALGWRSLDEHARAVAAALAGGELAEARRRVGRMVSRDTADMTPAEASKATVESVLENGNDAVFGALFWFAVAGAPGAVAYRLANTLDAMWGYRNARYRQFGWAAARLDDALNFIPARLTALSYAVFATASMPSPQPLMKPLPFGISRLRGFIRALTCWRQQAPAWESPNAGPVMAAGAGALGLALGGSACYEGVPHRRPPLGKGDEAAPADIGRALNLVRNGVLLWLALIVAWEGLHA